MTRAVWAATVAGLVVLLGACGAGTATQVGAGAARRTATPTTTAAPTRVPSTSAIATGTAGLKAVSFGHATFDVPAGWPVYDLTATPHRCAQFDLHAVYLGHQAADAACPARALGKTEAVQVEADDPYAQARVMPSAATAQINGQAVAYEPGGEASHDVVATFPGLGIVMTATYGTDAGVAGQIVASVRKSGS